MTRLSGLFQKFVSLFLTFIAALSISGVQWKDGMAGREFPRIAPTVKEADDLRVMSFNVRCEDVNGTPAALRRQIVVREILKVAPDVLGVQEATPTWMAALQSMLPAYGSVGVARDNGRTVARQGESCPIFYLKEKYELLEHGDFWLSDTPDKPSFGPGAGCRRVCTWALLQEKATEAIFVHVNTHLDNGSEPARVQGAQQIVSFLKDRFAKSIPVVFTADLNSGEEDAAYRIMTEALTDTNFAAADSVAFPTWHDGNPGENSFWTLDYVLCSANVTANVFRTVTDGIDGRLVSDHFPIYADVTLPPIPDSFAGHDFPLIEPAPKSEGITRIMSFNVRCNDVNGVSADYRTALIPQQILAAQPDSVGLQECTPTFMKALKRMLPEYGWVGLERDEGKRADRSGESCPIFYLRTKYILLDHGDFWLSDTPDEPSFGPGAACRRICTWAKLKNIRTGEVFVHVNSHFDHISEAAREAGARIVTAYINDHFADVPVVFTADMNTQDQSEAYAVMTESFVNTRFAAADAESFGTFHACSPETHANAYIDYVLCSQTIGVSAYRTVTAGINGRFVSDHFPIYADVTIPGAREPIC